MRAKLAAAVAMAVLIVAGSGGSALGLDARAAWGQVPSPNHGTKANELAGLAVVAPGDIWAVGEAGYPETGLVLRWNGTRWRSVANGCGVPLNGVTVVSATDVWAAGEDTTCHYDGTYWQVVPSPQPRGQYSEIAYVLQD